LGFWGFGINHGLSFLEVRLWPALALSHDLSFRLAHWLVRSSDLLSQESLEVVAVEPRMLHDLFWTVDSKPLLRIFVKKSRDETLDIFTHLDLVLHRIGEDDGAFDDQRTELLVVLVEERRSSCNKLVCKNTKCPPINSIRM